MSAANETEANPVAVNQESMPAKNKVNDQVVIPMEIVTNYSYVDPPVGLFSDKEVRRQFIRKVYSILTLQIAFTTVIAAIMFFLYRNHHSYRYS